MFKQFFRETCSTSKYFMAKQWILSYITLVKVDYPAKPIGVNLPQK